MFKRDQALGHMQHQCQWPNCRFTLSLCEGVYLRKLLDQVYIVCIYMYVLQNTLISKAQAYNPKAQHPQRQTQAPPLTLHPKPHTLPRSLQRQPHL